MKAFKRALGTILAIFFVVTLCFTNSVTADASYTYQIKILLGNNSDAYFDTNEINNLKSKYDVETADGITIKNLKYNEKLVLNIADLIKTKSTSKYYVKGIKVAGSDGLIEMDINKNATLNITGDESYVVAYGVGERIPYTVRYVDKNDRKLYNDEILYAGEGEVIYVPARHLKGYEPDALYRTDSTGLKKDTVFKFVYDKAKSSSDVRVINIYDDRDEYRYIDGGNRYEYEYKYVDGKTTEVTRTNDNSTVTYEQRPTRNVAGTDTTTVENVEGNTDGNTTGNSNDTVIDISEGVTNNRTEDNTPGDESEAETDSTTTIEDEEAPKGITVDPEEMMPKPQESNNGISYNIIIMVIILFIALVIILLILFYMRKKKQPISQVKKSDDLQK